MKYQIVGYKNGILCLIDLRLDAIAKVTPLITHQPGPSGRVTKMPTPEEDRINNEKEIDRSLKGVINKNKKEKK